MYHIQQGFVQLPLEDAEFVFNALIAFIAISNTDEDAVIIRNSREYLTTNFSNIIHSSKKGIDLVNINLRRIMFDNVSFNIKPIQYEPASVDTAYFKQREIERLQQSKKDILAEFRQRYPELAQNFESVYNNPAINKTLRFDDNDVVNAFQGRIMPTLTSRPPRDYATNLKIIKDVWDRLAQYERELQKFNTQMNFYGIVQNILGPLVDQTVESALILEGLNYNVNFEDLRISETQTKKYVSQFDKNMLNAVEESYLIDVYQQVTYIIYEYMWHKSVLSMYRIFEFMRYNRRPEFLKGIKNNVDEFNDALLTMTTSNPADVRNAYRECVQRVLGAIGMKRLQTVFKQLIALQTSMESFFAADLDYFRSGTAKFEEMKMLRRIREAYFGSTPETTTDIMSGMGYEKFIISDTRGRGYR